jgi:hypothetical protein
VIGLNYDHKEEREQGREKRARSGILKGERSGLWTRTATVESVSLRATMKS